MLPHDRAGSRLPSGLRRLLHRAVDFFADSRHAERQAGRNPLVQLDNTNLCRIFGSPERPAVCASLQPAMDLTRLEQLTAV